MNYKTKGLNELSNNLHEFQMKAGFTDSSISQRLMLVHTEISEAFEAFRTDHFANRKDFELLMHGCTPGNSPDHFKDSFEKHIKDSMEDEMADAVIRLLAFCGENGIDIEHHINQKMKYNELRGYKYGGKKF